MNVLRLLFALLLLAGLSVRAQENLIGTIGLAHTDLNGRNWAYITWQGNDGAGIANEAFAVYGKPGDASSTSNYSRFSIVSRQQDTHVIQSLLQRGVNLGDNLVVLDGDLAKLFGDVIPAGTISLSDKLSAVLRGTTGNDRSFRNLTLLARIHPGVALNLGIAVAEQFPAGVSNMTFEVRRWNLATASDRAVVGRVTVQAGSRLMLPAPGAAVELPDTTGSGNLNVKMRWAVPDALRRLGLATHGFNVWRVNKNYAEAAGWNLSPPTADQLLGGSATSPLVVRRINTVPILAAKYFSPADVANFGTNGDAATFFFTDNNDAFKGAQPFVDGAGYYYYVTARDLLGRDGTPSPGTLLKACDRIPPQPPRNLRVRPVHAYLPGNLSDGLLLSWEPPIGGGPGLAYHVYRYESLAELKANSGSVVSNHIAGPLTFPPNTDPLRYIDRPCTNSFITTSNTTFWYVVRATETTACGTNVSNPSGPGFGSCRAWSGPGAINGIFYTTCLVPSVVCHTNGLAPNPNPNPNCCPYRLICYRESSAIEWAEFSYQRNGVQLTNRVYFTSKGNSVTIEVCLPSGQPQQIRCCVGTSGKTVAALVRAVDIHGNLGPLSNEEDFTGALEKIMLVPQVAWPARALPLPAAHTYDPALTIRQIKDDGCFEGVGIVVGRTELENFFSCVDLLVSKPKTETSTDELGRSVFPFVVYRQQVANAWFPIVSGDVLQVTPLIEKVYLEEDSPPNANYWRMRDSFMMLRANGVQQLSDIIVRDTQPVVAGARYRYTLVRFKTNHEIEEIVPAGEIEVTE